MSFLEFALNPSQIFGLPLLAFRIWLPASMAVAAASSMYAIRLSSEEKQSAFHALETQSGSWAIFDLLIESCYARML
jgi:hypothetical protein